MKYIGRAKELELVQNALRSERSGRIAIIGERGIGKSNLLTEVAKIARELNHATAFVSIDPSLTPDTFAERLQLSLDTSSEGLDWFAKVVERARNVHEVGFAGASLSIGTPMEFGSLEKFCFTLIRAFGGRRRGKGMKGDAVTLIIDEVDAADNSRLPIGACLKTLIEYFDFHGAERINFVIAGLPRMRAAIHETHPSAWREFVNVPLRRLGKEDSVELIDEVLANRPGELKSMREDGRDEVLRLATGYPHWLLELTEAAASAAGEGSMISRHHVGLGKPQAFRSVWENYYANDFESLGDRAKYVLRLIAIHANTKVRLDRVERIAGLERREFEQAVGVLEGANIIEVTDEGLYQNATLLSVAYRHQLSQILHPLLDPLGLSEFWSDADRDLVGLRIAGEKGAPTFLRFCELVAPQFDVDDDVKFIEFDSTHNLFDTFREPSPIREARIEWNALLKRGKHEPALGKTVAAGGDVEEEKGRPLSTHSRDGHAMATEFVPPGAGFADVWEKSDLICIPHYMLGRVTTLGVWTFDELFGDRCDDLREYFRYILHDFEESCTFDGHWIAAPFTYLTKVLVSKEDLETPRRWDHLSRGKAIPARIDRKPGSISMWYEWRQHIDERTQWPLFEASRRSDELPAVSKDAQTYARLIRDADDKPLEGVFYKSIRAFRDLLLLTDEVTGSGDYWLSYPEFAKPDSDARFMSMWIDWASQLQRDAAGRDMHLYWYDLPSLPGLKAKNGSAQPIESWVFVIPRVSSSRGHRARAAKIADLLMSTLSMGWQLQFQQKGGCSPVAWLINSSGARPKGDDFSADHIELQPWNEAIIKSLGDRQIRGKSRRESEFIQAEVSFLTAMFFGVDGNLLESLHDDAEFSARFRILFPAFIDLLRKLSLRTL